ACVWLHERETRGRARAFLLQGMLAVNLALQTATGFAALRTDHLREFSGSIEAARFIRDHHLEREPIIADRDHPTSAVAIVLDRPFRFAASGETSDTIVAHNRVYQVTRYSLVHEALQLAQAAHGSALIVADYPLALPMPGYDVRELHRGDTPIMFDEAFW